MALARSGVAVMQKLAMLLPLMSAVLMSSPVRAESLKGIDGQTVAVAVPKRVVAVNSALVEILFALGKGDTVVGTDVAGTHPPPPHKNPKQGHPYRPPPPSSGGPRNCPCSSWRTPARTGWRGSSGASPCSRGSTKSPRSASG